MASRSFRPRGRPRPGTGIAELVREAKERARARGQGYRERALEMYGWICGKCAREFERDNLHLLTVHHRDGNHHNNPPDGSNWELLCADCHEAEHSKELLADYVSGSRRK